MRVTAQGMQLTPSCAAVDSAIGNMKAAAALLVITLIFTVDTLIKVRTLGNLFPFLVGLIAIAFLVFLNRKGWVKAASLGLSLLGLALPTLFIVLDGGFKSPGISTYIFGIVIAGLLIGGRASILFALLSTMLVFVRTIGARGRY